ncbi:hypothetical protein M5X00_00585 [Paenibacillus alvei]|uniref:Uncharacterized protein n=1 Tax=Paenibacillus alvei TaxID=44250 RepID=A0ABT4H225_PAEAL|nr:MULTISPECIES: hypothetical protein [Paenibacillus]EJW13757.1 hypothetical protein PAV_16p00050 [Paenibacillus alvei DSM 29]MCY9543364.1 hypothetical protein [Paenibacillus alvei]MCY9702615.1 hypothetical protein [Paenibacillus alvei]MCY9732616.1 hypothetical protein [Paenibacillus alvei]MCY9752754.1 hypothetical protein [Paenibacillus alvei]
MEVREYPQTLELNLNQVLDLMGAQRTIYLDGFGKNTSTGALTNKLGEFSTAMGILFSAASGAAATAGGWAATILGVVAGIGSGAPTLESYVKNGSFYLTGVADFLRKNTQYDRIRVLVPMIEYNTVDGYVRFVIGEGQTTGLHYRGGDWVTDQ